ncbi:MAG: transposase domain-containing protein [Lachnospiraceae bacterium]|nr:transposase domain-containing protein [Lachnospiraceae bacterium]
MAKANGINPLKYLEYILDARPNKEMLDEELEKLSPWNDEVKRACQSYPITSIAVKICLK